MLLTGGIILCVFILFSRSVPCESIRLLDFSGTTNYDLGHQIGQRTKADILTTKAFLKDELNFYLNWTRNDTNITYRRIIDNQFLYFPSLMQEIQGMADGSDILFDELMILNMIDELELIHPYPNGIKHWKRGKGSDVMVNKNNMISGHNEDGDSFYENLLYLLRWTNTSANIPSLNSTNSKDSQWMSLVYPGRLGGSGYSFNRFGLIFSVDQLTPNVTNAATGACAWLLSRAILRSVSITETLDVLTRFPIMSGMTLNIASVSENKMAVVELAAPDNVAITFMNRFDSKTISHFNTYQKLNVVYQASASSDHRMNVFENMGSFSNVSNIVSFLGDTSDAQFPVYRTPSTSDPYKTLTTSIFDLNARTFSVFQSNPKFNAPQYVFAIEANSLIPTSCPHIDDISDVLVVLVIVATSLLILICVWYIWRAVHKKSQQMTVNSMQGFASPVHSRVFSDLGRDIDSEEHDKLSLYGHIDSSSHFPGFAEEM